MYAQVKSETTVGLNGIPVIVEVDLARGLPAFEIVGLPNLAVKEARERVRTALKNSGFPFPPQKITVNLAPADIKKDGSGLDLPIAIGILISSGLLPQEKVRDQVFLGELSLEGVIREVSGVLPMVLAAYEQGAAEVYIPSGNGDEGSLIHGMKVYTPKTLAQLVKHLRCPFLEPLLGEKTQREAENAMVSAASKTAANPVSSSALDAADLTAELPVDFAEVRGQLVAKRALEIAAAGGHNILLEGSPGSGKTMLARRLPTIMPPMTEAEALEVTKIYSIAGLLKNRGRLLNARPFRSPHHTISRSALAGGGSVPKPGDVSLS